jgi:hypothetical protein
MSYVVILMSFTAIFPSIGYGLPNGLISVFPGFLMAGAHEDYIPMCRARMFLFDLDLNRKLILNPSVHDMWI